MTTERQWRFNVYVAMAFGVVLVAFLVVRPPFPLDAIAVPENVTANVDSGSTGTELNEEGVYWWISSPEAMIRVVNNEPEPHTVVMSATLSNGPCAGSRTVSVGELSVKFEVAGQVDSVSTEFDLEGYERLALTVIVVGDPCPPSDTDSRPLYVRISDLQVAIP